ncbi:TetR/AcrR family transcriptional regulator [Agrococcus terreus]|uniref:TetR/AcrR family transcriptional regulator n=1 Tax=Agrococcus terreus TaxID=574649 RepID=UPI00384FA1EE
MTTSIRSGSAAADRQEPRAMRTREKVLGAVRAALTEVPLDELTVAEICRRAGIHRVTFYGHWSDVRAAADDAFAEELDRLAAVDEAFVAAATDPVALASRYEQQLAEQLRGIHEQRAAWSALLESPSFARRVLERLEARVQLAVDAFVALGVPVPGAANGIAAAHLAGGVVAASARWARGGDDDVEAAAAAIVAQVPAWWPGAHPPRG